MADTRLHPTPHGILVVLLGVCLFLAGCAAPTAHPRETAPNLGDWLASLAAATRDPDRWNEFIDETDPGFLVAADLLRKNLAQFDITFTPGSRIRHPSPARQALLGDEAEVREVIVAWAVPGESVPAEHTVWFTITGKHGGFRLAGITDGPSDTAPVPIWSQQPLQVTSGGTAAVIAPVGVDPHPWLDMLALAADRLAAHQIDQGFVVVSLPGNTDQFEAILGVRGSHRTTAAVAWPEGPAVRMVINPGPGAATTGAARRVLVTHEAVHVATRSTDLAAPLWLIEGYADWVALAEEPEAMEALDSLLREDQQRHGISRGLVTDTDLAPGKPRLAVNYHRAWLTVRLLDRGRGDAARVYADLQAGRTLAEALSAHGWDEAALAAALEAELTRMAA